MKMGIKENKSQIRLKMKTLKKSMTAEKIEENSSLIIDKLKAMPLFNDKEKIFVYVSYNQEVSTISFIKDQLALGTRKVLVPKVCGERNMRFYEISNFENDIAPGAYGILEPVKENSVNDDEINDDASVIILPGLAFDKEFNRIGYGGGYYDTFLQKHNKMLKIALCHDFQIIDECPQMEPTDIKADIIISEKRTFSRI